MERGKRLYCIVAYLRAEAMIQEERANARGAPSRGGPSIAAAEFAAVNRPGPARSVPISRCHAVTFRSPLHLWKRPGIAAWRDST